MNRFACLSATCLLLGAATLAPRDARATGCSSAASITSDIWAEWGTVIKVVGCAGVAAASGGLSFDSCYRTANKIDKIIQDMIAFWNKKSKNTWATIGPRRLDFDTWHEGNIIGTTGRMFISPYPATNKQVKVTVKKLDGKGKVDVVVCKRNSTNKAEQVTNHVFANGTDNIGKEWEYTVKGAKDDVITIHIDGKSVANSFKYKLKAKLLADDTSGGATNTVDRSSPRSSSTPTKSAPSKSAAPVRR